MKHRWIAWAVAGALMVSPFVTNTLSSHADTSDEGQDLTIKTATKVFGSAEGQSLKDNGFIKGGDGGQLMEASQLTREQLAILTAQLMGEEANAKSFQVASGYTDDASFPSWSRPYISYNKARGWMKGNDGKFDNLGYVSAEELAVVLLRALGYPTEAWGKNVAGLARAGVDFEKLGVMSAYNSPTEQKVSRGQAFVAMWESVSKSVMKSGECLGVKLGKMKNPLDELSVRGVKVVSMKTLLVEFSREMSIINPEDLSVLAGSPQKISKVEQIDELTFRISMLNPLPRNAKITLKSENLFVRKLSTQFAIEYVFEMKDEIKPEVISVKKANEVRLVLTFSEELSDRRGIVKVEKDGEEIGSNFHVKGAEVHVTLLKSLEPGDKLSIFVERFKDLSENEMTYTTQEYRVPTEE